MAKRDVDDPGSECRCGARQSGVIEQAVRDDLRTLGSTHLMRSGLTELAIALAQTLDKGAGLAVAAVSRELRATLTALAAQSDGDDDDLEDELSGG